MDVELFVTAELEAKILCDDEELGEIRSIGDELPDPNPLTNEATNEEGSAALLKSLFGKGSKPLCNLPVSVCRI
jgi:hypothetical protein